MADIHETKVSLGFYGDDLQPQEISDALRCQPDASAPRGELLRRPNGSEGVARTGTWLKRVARRSPGDLDGQIVELLRQMTDDLAIWQHLTARFSSRVFCGLFLEEGNEGAIIRPRTLLALGSRGLRLDLDIYGPSGPRDDDPA